MLTMSPVVFSDVTLRQQLILGRKPLALLPHPYPQMQTLHRQRVHSEAGQHSRNRTCQAQACSDSLLFRNGSSSPFILD